MTIWPWLFRSFRIAQVAAGARRVRRPQVQHHQVRLERGGDRDGLAGGARLPDLSSPETPPRAGTQRRDGPAGGRPPAAPSPATRHALVPGRRQGQPLHHQAVAIGVDAQLQRPAERGRRGRRSCRDPNRAPTAPRARPRGVRSACSPHCICSTRMTSCAPQRSVAITCSASACLTALRRPSRSASMTSPVTSGASPRGVPRWLHHTGTPLAAVKVRASATSARSSPRPSGIRHRSARVVAQLRSGHAGDRLDLGEALRQQRPGPSRTGTGGPARPSRTGSAQWNRAAGPRSPAAAGARPARPALALAARWCSAVPASAASPSSRTTAMSPGVDGGPDRGVEQGVRSRPGRAPARRRCRGCLRRRPPRGSPG